MHIPTNILRKAREEAGLKQSEIANRLGVSGSVISRLEKSEITDEVMARRYLEALGTTTGDDIIEFYSRDWRITERPSFFHINRDSLWAGEIALQQLDTFSKSEEYDSLLDVPLAQIRSNLETAISFIARLDHGMAFVGPAGVGKTTALSLLTNLVVTGKNGQPQPVFPATGGRTTISEVLVRVAPAYGIAVEPMDEDAVRLVVTEFVVGIARNEGGVSTELERAIRNMADLRSVKDEKRTKIDPVREMLDNKKGEVEDVVEEVISRINLAARTETQLILSENTEDGLRWLSENITKINYGQHPRFSLPDRVTVFVPASTLRATRYDLSVIDTKGIHGTTLRQDLRAHLDDPRTLSILCCMFNDAPGTDTLKLMKELKVMGSDAIERQRIVILALPRGDEAMKVIDDPLDPPQSPEEGYAIRADQVRDTLRKETLAETPVIFFNAMTDTPSDIWKRLSGQLESLRQRQLDKLQRFVDVSAEFVTNADAAKIQQARAAIAEEIARMTQAYPRPKPLVRPAHKNLIEELESGHASSIAAAVTRKGAWSNFPIHHMIGVGVRIDANLRTSDIFVKLDGRLEGLAQKFSALPEIATIVESLRENLSEWRQEFLEKALTIGRVAFKPHLDSASDLWVGLSVYWGQGSGYRMKVIADVKDWFDHTEELADARTRVESRLRESWRELVTQRLISAMQLSERELAA
jgi:transcriptional regulator with XRE-family HTH domain